MASPLSLEHEGLLLLFRNRLSLAPECLRDILGSPIPAFAKIKVVEAKGAQVVAANRAPDLVLLLENERGGIVRVLIVEIQRSTDKEKVRSWPLYITLSGAKYQCDVTLLVVAPDERVATWARGPFRTGHPDFELKPLVLGPSNVPGRIDLKRAAEAPELAVLACIAHAKDPEQERVRELAETTIALCRGLLDEEPFSIYADLILNSLGRTARAAVESFMATSNYEYQSDYFRQKIANWRREGLEEGRKVGREEGREAGREEGREEGREVGREEGRVNGEANALLTVLEARGLSIPDHARTRILATTNMDLLERWIRRAVSASSVEELFQD